MIEFTDENKAKLNLAFVSLTKVLDRANQATQDGDFLLASMHLTDLQLRVDKVELLLRMAAKVLQPDVDLKEKFAVWDAETQLDKKGTN